MTRSSVLLAAMLLASAAAAEPTPQQIEKIMQRDFHPRGQATMDRTIQDGLQRICTESRNQPSAEIAKRLEADQLKTIAFPAGNLVGDWQRGEKIAQGGRGLTWSDASGAPSDGSCYNCHQLSGAEASHGTIGPSLRGFGKTRGNGPDIQRYVYGKIYNAKAYNACSQMPRLGYSGTLTEEQIKDLVGLLLDPASPVNR